MQVCKRLRCGLHSYTNIVMATFLVAKVNTGCFCQFMLLTHMANSCILLFVFFFTMPIHRYPFPHQICHLLSYIWHDICWVLPLRSYIVLIMRNPEVWHAVPWPMAVDLSRVLRCLLFCCPCDVTLVWAPTHLTMYFCFILYLFCNIRVVCSLHLQSSYAIGHIQICGFDSER